MLLVSIGGWIAIGVVAILIVALVALVINVYNKMVKGRNRCKDAFSQIDVQLTRRFDLIPNLVETVKGYAKHEESILEEFARARGAYQNANGDIDRFMAVSEQYPELKADAQFNAMINTLKETEDKIAITRQFYNDTVTSYNTLLQLFPNVIFANMFGFHDEKLFKASEEERKNVKVQF